MTLDKNLRLWPLTLRRGPRVIRWVFGYEHDYELHARHILPWAMPDHARVSDETPADWTIGFHVRPQEIAAFAELPGRKMLVDGENRRSPVIDDCLSFVQGHDAQDDPRRTRRAPVMCHWVPPTGAGPGKIRCASVVDSGRRPHRAALIRRLTETIGRDRTDWFGAISGGGGRLDGYHKLSTSTVGNEKYLGIRDHAFYLAIERTQSLDYVTEKLWDAILQEAVPIYWGAANVEDYVMPLAYMPFEDAEKHDWAMWQIEYSRRRPAVLAQKELVRTRFNAFSYFDHLTARPELLDAERPITRHTML